MSSTESKLMWVAIALSLLLVLALTTLAIYSVLGLDGDERADGETPVEPAVDEPLASPGRTEAWSDVDPSVIVECRPADDRAGDYTVLVANPGTTTLDYLVLIELTVAGSRPVVAATDVPDLGPGERRQLDVATAGPSDRTITACSIAAVQSDRRILLATS